MSTPMTMPVPFQQFMIHPLQVNSSSSHPLPPSLDSAHSGISPSNHSTVSSAYPHSTSTAATSPVSNYQAMALLGPGNFMPQQPINPNTTTRVLLLADFNKELKTRDIQHVFADWEDDRGGFKIKWVDDVSCLVVFADPGVAKRAFLGVLSNPPASLTAIQPDGSVKTATLRAYNKPDVPQILASVQNRPRSRSNASQSLHSRASSTASMGGLGRRPSMGTMAARNRTSLSGPTGLPSRAGSIASIPPNPLGELMNNGSSSAHNGALSINSATSQANPATSDTPDSSMRPRIEDAGKRFIASGLSKPVSAITHQPISELDENQNTATYNLANLTIEEESLTPTAASH
ncbi:hypothetical protein MJO28_004628 [Puccinia striiformis f. sp. tritici]|uniref:Uncharacterized protein n=4 Tax=Puccinia striiformis TaxID=27350 RepID=A0A0L0V7M3_9BASI|nr:hypothetical protein Pst134EA_006765 [Puccinia striiformis f. sp. tritici]KAI9616799.1 hypothetical protein KEM48_005045 [Puccinia striiformis f. sp. tritici PST-130]KNE95315.1 hypothetical protein PSTG_11395 [Puccinia striiformis f. sp. tritici PST-78]POW20352.1 hypothetical protein PSHT_03604 [Puccinia striiformis]KAH9469477.1 hypothetical protein Pst134EA_006765 [Puccinia striiformis f. sp. tritici]KAI7957533.1 hypothetical protein MJO28_004628 [Puccinia striiformis f. sp. tritici]